MTRLDAESNALIYVHDPMCSWCWAFRPALGRLLESLPADIEFLRLLGGLAPDSDQPMPEAMQQQLQQTWKTIQARVPGTEFNFDFWKVCQPRRSTYPACRAVIAARQQGGKFDPLITEAIQRAYYLEAKNPSDKATLVEVAGTIGLDTELFTQSLGSEETEQELMEEINLLRVLGVQGFPALLRVHDNQARQIPVDHNDAAAMLAAIERTA